MRINRKLLNIAGGVITPPALISTRRTEIELTYEVLPDNTDFTHSVSPFFKDEFIIGINDDNGAIGNDIVAVLNGGVDTSGAIHSGFTFDDGTGNETPLEFNFAICYSSIDSNNTYLTRAQLRKYAGSGTIDLSNHTFQHTFTNAAYQLQTNFDAVKNNVDGFRMSTTTEPGGERGGVIPSKNRGDAAYFSEGFGSGGVNAEGLPVFWSELWDLGVAANNPLFSLVTRLNADNMFIENQPALRTWLNNKITQVNEQNRIAALPYFSHGVEIPQFKSFVEYTQAHPVAGRMAWMKASRVTDHLNNKALSTVEKTVTGNKIKYVINHEGTGPNVAELALYLNLPQGTITSATIKGVQKANINFENNRLVTYKTVGKAEKTVSLGTVQKVYGKIPLDAERIFMDSASTQRTEQFTDGNIANNVELQIGDYWWQKRCKIVAQLDPRLKAEVDVVKFGNGQHDASGEPMHSWYLDPDTLQEIPAFDFDGKNGNGVFTVNNFPEPKRFDDFIFQFTYPMPTELEFWGWYIPGIVDYELPEVNPEVQFAAGSVDYVYDFAKASGEGLDFVKLQLAAKGFHVVRLYCDFGNCYVAETGKFTFDPMVGGAWPLDRILQHFYDIGIYVILCPKGMDGHPMFPRLVEQIEIRYGNNTNVDPAKVLVDTRPGFGPTSNVVKIGMGILPAVQISNEQVRWWKDKANIAEQTNLEGNMTHYEVFLQHKACYDFVKRDNPDMRVVSLGNPSDKPGTFLALAWYCKLFNNNHLVFDDVAYHQYINANLGGQNGGGSPVGVEPEKEDYMYKNAMRVRRAMYRTQMEFSTPEKEIRCGITEIGYSHALPSDSLNRPTNPEQIAVPTPGYDIFRTHLNWGIRSDFVGLDAGLSFNCKYQGYNDGAGIYYPHRWLNWDLMNGIFFAEINGTIGLYPISDAVQQYKAFLFGYRKTRTDRTSPLFHVRYFSKSGANAVVEFNMITHGQDMELDIQLDVPAGKQAVLKTFNIGPMNREFYYHDPQDGVDVYIDRYTPGTETLDSTPLVVSNGKVTVKAKEEPQFVEFI